MRFVRNERGIALAVSIFAIIIIGGLVGAAFFVGMQEQRIGRSSVKLQQAFSAADGGAQAVLATWNKTIYNNLAVPGTATITQTWLPGNAGWYRGSVQRVNQQLFLIQIEGFSKDSTARQQVGLLTRLNIFQLNVKAGLTTRGATKVGGSSFINGNDTPPTGWIGCPPLSPPLPAIRLPPQDSTKISLSGCSNYSCLSGTPQIKTDTSVSYNSLTNFGGITLSTLRGMADLVLAPGTYTGINPQVSGTTCVTSNQLNWGDPINQASTCATYFPLIYIDGSTSITGNLGQGVLVVNGDLSVDGGFQFFGPVIINGGLKTTGTGGHFNGGVLAADSTSLGQNTVLGSARELFQLCSHESAQCDRRRKRDQRAELGQPVLAVA
jgi:hypothetical protein